MNRLAHRRNPGTSPNSRSSRSCSRSSSQAGEVKLDGRAFTIPEGFSIERIAGPPLVDRPITAAFDDEGRLYVADSSGSNDNVKKQLAEKPHRIVRLEDSDGDGKFDKRTIFADKMMFPEGTMWYDGSLYVAAPPSIWKLTDTNGDGVADQRVEWFAGKTLTGCANDLHGPYLGLDGWIYWCKGAFAQQTYERPGKSPFVTRAAHIFRCRPDGTGIEPVMTGGMDNPVDVVFTPGGERIFTTTFLVNPGGGQRDGLIHAIYGGIYGKVHDQIFDPVHKWTGPEVMPVLLHMGPAAPCGLTRYESDAFGKAYQDNLFACYFNLHKVSRHVLTPHGATFTTKDEDFVSSSDLDFHPTDVIEDADGSLVIVDTGGWYKLCCPTSQLHKPDVLGAIYRVKRQGTPKARRSARDDNLEAVRRHPYCRAREGHSSSCSAIRARPCSGTMIEVLVASRGTKTANLHVLSRGTLPRCHAALAPQRRLDARADRRSRRAGRWSKTFFDDPDETVRQAAIHVAGLWRDKCAVAADRAAAIDRRLRTAAPRPRRWGESATSRPCRRSWRPRVTADDRILEHSITYALIEIGDPKGTEAGLSSDKPTNDQGRDGRARPDGRRRARPEVRRGAAGLGGAGPQGDGGRGSSAGTRDWADALAGVLGERLSLIDLPPADRVELERQLGRFAAGGSDPAAAGRSGCETLSRHWPRGGAACRPWPGRT